MFSNRRQIVVTERDVEEDQISLSSKLAPPSCTLCFLLLRVLLDTADDDLVDSW